MDTETTNHSRDYWAYHDQVFITGDKGFSDDCTCLGPAAEIEAFMTGGDLPGNISKHAIGILKEIRKGEKEYARIDRNTAKRTIQPGISKTRNFGRGLMLASRNRPQSTRRVTRTKRISCCIS